jgi:hypothetical protein
MGTDLIHHGRRRRRRRRSSRRMRRTMTRAEGWKQRFRRKRNRGRKEQEKSEREKQREGPVVLQLGPVAWRSGPFVLAAVNSREPEARRFAISDIRLALMRTESYCWEPHTRYKTQLYFMTGLWDPPKPPVQWVTSFKRPKRDADYSAICVYSAMSL